MRPFQYIKKYLKKAASENIESEYLYSPSLEQHKIYGSEFSFSAPSQNILHHILRQEVSEDLLRHEGVL